MSELDPFGAEWDRPRWTNRLTWVLVAAVVAALAFAGGLLIERQYDTTLLTSARGTARPAGGGLAIAGLGGGRSGAGRAANASGSGAGGSSGPAGAGSASGGAGGAGAGEGGGANGASGASGAASSGAGAGPGAGDGAAGPANGAGAGGGAGAAPPAYGANGAGAGTPAGAGDGEAPVPVGTVASVNADRLTLTDFAGKTVTVTVPPNATVTTSGLAGLKPGAPVSVIGTANPDGSVTATSITSRTTGG